MNSHGQEVHRTSGTKSPESLRALLFTDYSILRQQKIMCEPIQRSIKIDLVGQNN